VDPIENDAPVLPREQPEEQAAESRQTQSQPPEIEPAEGENAGDKKSMHYV